MVNVATPRLPRIMPNKRKHPARFSVPRRPNSEQSASLLANETTDSDTISLALRADSAVTVDYLTGQPRRPKPADTPAELLIEGGQGSLMMDLRGLGVELHPEAFAFRMPDDCLIQENIRRGDIAVIEPCVHELAEGDIVMVPLAGVATLRRVTYRGTIAYFQGYSAQETLVTPVWDNAFSGVAVAIFRTFYHGRLMSQPGTPARVTPESTFCNGRGQTKVKSSRQVLGLRLRDDPQNPFIRPPQERD